MSVKAYMAPYILSKYFMYKLILEWNTLKKIPYLKYLSFEKKKKERKKE